MQIAPATGLTMDGDEQRRRLARALTAALERVPERQLPTDAAHTFRTFEIGPLSTAGGSWEVDWERAHADAQLVLDAIDFSKRDIVIWVPGTSNHGVHPAFAAAARDSWRGQGSNIVALDYEATWHLRRSLPTGYATLRLVLEGIAARGGDHRVLLGGESQGAWIIGEIAADPAVSRIIDRAVLLGHPTLAAHQYTQGQDPRVRVINHAGDQVSLPINGDPTVALDAMIAMRTLQLTRIGDVAKALAANPRHAVEMLKNLVFAVPILKGLLKNPHVYDGEMSRAVEFLRHGELPVSAEFARIAGIAPAPELSDPAHHEDAHDALRRRLAAAVAAA